MEPVLRFISQRPWVVLSVLLMTSALALAQLVDLGTGELLLRLDPSTNRLLPEDDEDKIFYDYVRKLFGSDETMIVALSADDVFTAAPESIIEEGSVYVASEVVMTDVRDETHTNATIEDLEVDRDIPDREFTISQLSKRR